MSYICLNKTDSKIKNYRYHVTKQSYSRLFQLCERSIIYKYHDISLGKVKEKDKISLLFIIYDTTS